MADIRKLLESIDSLSESSTGSLAFPDHDIPGSVQTTANSEAFMKDIVKAFGGVKGQTLEIKVTLKGNNVLEYSIQRIGQPPMPGTDFDPYY